MFVVISFFGLVFSFVISDFSNETVFNNSHTAKPLFYKITGTWGNHEGSLLLWLLVLTLFIFLFLLRTKNQSKQYRILTLLFQQIIIIGFFVFLLKTSNPFNYVYPIPNEGLGLNPILQDPALAIHPPILYLGYVGTSIIFSAALSATVLNYISKKWASHIKKWVLISWVFLTFGILLGSIWAYYELGWGGFWFWDPVENVSLMPWFALTTLLHCILVLERRLILTSWVIVLSIATFTLSMCGTFLVRSGILNSVHTYTKKLHELAPKLIHSIAEGFGLSAEVEFGRATKVLMNDAASVERVETVAKSLVGEAGYVPMQNPIAGGEDFASIVAEVPGAFVFVGACRPEIDYQTAPTNHSAKATFDDSVLPLCSALLASLAMEHLG